MGVVVWLLFHSIKMLNELKRPKKERIKSIRTSLKTDRRIGFKSQRYLQAKAANAHKVNKIQILRTWLKLILSKTNQWCMKSSFSFKCYEIMIDFNVMLWGKYNLLVQICFNFSNLFNAMIFLLDIKLNNHILYMLKGKKIKNSRLCYQYYSTNNCVFQIYKQIFTNCGLKYKWRNRSQRSKSFECISKYG